MFKLLIIADLSKQDILASTIEYFAGNGLHIDLLSIYKPRKEDVSIINLNDIIYREKVNRMNVFIAAQLNTHRFFKDFSLFGKVRLGIIEKLLQDELNKKFYDGVLLFEEVQKAKIRKLSALNTPIFSLTKSEGKDYIRFENAIPLASKEHLFNTLSKLNPSSKKDVFKLDIPVSNSDFS
ncbi:hypothetical protein [Brumimicrobium aurantiacum]|uniref:Uncharacterized protein n=1 Tax=Brumimicrobium aurantiacum TaxID=1737063 RepID=A0A3E1EV19_9FLAO|nr:hypothetical protein [Brumimicrobium aurantiacum]RFC53368.1 hypothetical protein DXU93_13120 [Brumimicrobium aurantiacum]